MIASIHLAVGAASVLFIQRWIPVKDSTGVRCAFGFGIAILSHIVLDSISHPEYGLQGEILFALLCFECIATIGAVYAWQKPIVGRLLMWGMIGGALPDVLFFGYQYTSIGLLLWLHNIAHFFHGKLSLLYIGNPLQIAMAIIAVIYIRIKSAQ